MSLRKNIAAGNWKMNTDSTKSVELAKIITQAKSDINTQVILGVPFPFLTKVISVVQEFDHIFVAAQNCSNKESGAYTGEVSASMLRSIDCNAVILGHSERRTLFAESDEVIKEKVDIALENDLRVIFCCGESLETRKAGKEESFVESQLKSSLLHLDAEQLQSVVIAYEPIWAIGTGETASSAQAQSMHKFIRAVLSAQYGHNVADNVSILYGGSVKAANAKELFVQADVDGGLVGGASLDGEQFISIIESF